MSLKSNRIVIEAPAKVNLFLDITGRLQNGYHTLNTVMQQISLADSVEITAEQGDGCVIQCSNSAIPCDERNIAFKACKMFMGVVGEKAKITVAIHKRIPVEAGLGGSSTDGAAVLRGLNILYGRPLSLQQLCEIGASLGADVPFCLTGGTAICTGIGDKCKRIPTPENLFFVIIKPDFANNTSKAYRLYDQKPLPVNQDFADFVSLLEKGERDTLAGKMYNVFQRLYSDGRVEKIAMDLLEAGAKGACMSGSGSAVFGVFDSEKAAELAAEKLSYNNKYTAKASQGLQL